MDNLRKKTGIVGADGKEATRELTEEEKEAHYLTLNVMNLLETVQRLVAAQEFLEHLIKTAEEDPDKPPHAAKHIKQSKKELNKIHEATQYLQHVARSFVSPEAPKNG